MKPGPVPRRTRASIVTTLRHVPRGPHGKRLLYAGTRVLILEERKDSNGLKLLVRPIDETTQPFQISARDTDYDLSQFVKVKDHGAT